MSTAATDSPIKLVIFDWAGTTVDHGCFAPVAPFVEALSARGIKVTVDQVRGPMGLHKRDHLRTLLELPEIRARWREAHGSDWTEADLDRLFEEEFAPRQLSSIRAVSRLISGLPECVEHLRLRGIKIGTTTGYFREAAELVYEAGRQQGYVPEANLCVSDVPRGRPAPWMVYRLMEMLDVYPPSAVIKVGDTVPDVGEGRNAGVWTVGIARTGSEVGLSEADWEVLPADQKRDRLATASQKLRDAGAHWVIESVAVLPEILPQIEQRAMEAGQP